MFIAYKPLQRTICRYLRETAFVVFICGGKAFLGPPREWKAPNKKQNSHGLSKKRICS